MKRASVLGLLLLLQVTHNQAETLRFNHGSNLLRGEYLTPTTAAAPKAVILFVHGDGASSYDAEGYYDIIWQPLREHGYAIFSWDKPGVGKSTGDWQQQSMQERQAEVLAAVAAVQHQYGFNAANTGLLGFSQAGWVIPALADAKHPIGFMIGIGFATNWIEQGRYFNKTQQRLTGSSASEAEQALLAYQREIDFLITKPSYADYLKFSDAPEMSPARFQFVVKNVTADASKDYRNIGVPTLLLWGEDDLNVDANNEFAQWQTRSQTLISSKLIVAANHSMLNSASFNSQQFSSSQWLSLMWQQQDALAPDFINTLLTWLSSIDNHD